MNPSSTERMMWTADELREVALRAREHHARMVPREMWMPLSDTYKKWLRDIGFTEEEVEGWRDGF